MKINGWDISGAQAKQWNVIPGFSNIENESEWQRGSPLPFFVNGSIGWKTIQITFLVYRSCKTAVPYFPRCPSRSSWNWISSITSFVDS